MIEKIQKSISKQDTVFDGVAKFYILKKIMKQQN